MISDVHYIFKKDSIAKLFSLIFKILKFSIKGHLLANDMLYREEPCNHFCGITSC